LVEPEARAQKSIHQLIQDTDLNSCVPANGMMLIEDIQLGLCAVQPDIWQLREQIRRGTDVNNTIRQDFLRRKLELWKRWIDRIPLRPCDYTTLSEEQHMAMRFYYGMEDHSVSGWQAEVLGRPCDLIFDAFMLYQLLSLHLLADVRIFCQLVRDRIDTTLAVNFGPPYEQERLHRETTTREWTMTELARRALYHSANVLVAYESLPVAINQTVDPITFLALSVSAMVIWAYCTFGESDCRVCSGRPPGTRSTPVPGRTHALELTEVRDSEMVHGEKVIWVEKGNRQLAIFGIQLCRCNKGSLVARFNSCLPEGWDLAQYSTGSA
jgi:hypothetical protein